MRCDCVVVNARARACAHQEERKEKQRADARQKRDAGASSGRRGGAMAGATAAAAAAAGGTSGRSVPVFGVPLAALAERDGASVPLIVSRAVTYLTRVALDEEGLLRLSGARAEMDRLRAAWERGAPIEFDGPPPVDVHTAAGLLKAFFRELPEPLLPPDANRRAADIVAAGDSEIGTALALRDVVAALPEPAYMTMRCLVQVGLWCVHVWRRR
jgi:hypothetical protein